MTNKDAIKVLEMIEAHGSLAIRAKATAIESLKDIENGKYIEIDKNTNAKIVKLEDKRMLFCFAFDPEEIRKMKPREAERKIFNDFFNLFSFYLEDKEIGING